jgi:ankyrin repeat protein
MIPTEEKRQHPLPSPCALVRYRFDSSFYQNTLSLAVPKRIMPDQASTTTPTSASAPAPAPTTTTPTPTTPPKTVADLPPAALDLAAKLFDLARNGDTPTLSQYIAAGIPKNLTNASGDTLLMLAAYHGHTETVQMLLAAGADPNVLNGRGQSPIAGAVFKGWDGVVRALFEGGADVELGKPDAAQCALMFKRGEMLKLFGVDESASGKPSPLAAAQKSSTSNSDG